MGIYVRLLNSKRIWRFEFLWCRGYYSVWWRFDWGWSGPGQNKYMWRKIKTLIKIGKPIS